MRTLGVVVVLLGAMLALHAADSPDADFNVRLVDAARKVIADYKVFRRYGDEKFSQESRLKEVNDRVGDDDVTQEEMVSLRQETWALNEVDFNLNNARRQYRDRLAKSITAYKEIREQSKENAALKLPKDSEAALIKAEQVCKTPDALTLDVTLPSDAVKKPKPQEPPVPAVAAPAAPATPASGAKTDAPPAGAPGKPADAALTGALAKYNTILVGKIHGVLLRRDVPASDDRKWMVVIDVTEMLRGKAVPGNTVSIFIHSPAENFGPYETVSDLRGRPCVYALNFKDGVVTGFEAPFAQQKFDKEDVERLRNAFKE